MIKNRTGLKLAILAGALTLGTAAISFAQSASESMHQAGENVESAASNAYHGTKTAITDTNVTAKVKLALHNDALTKDDDIHVRTSGGVVTLRGTVPSSEVSAHAQKVAQDTSGVKRVKNRLKIGPHTED